MRSKNFILIALASVQFTNIMDSMIMMPLGKVFMEEFSINPQQFSFLVGAYALGAFITNLAGIFFLDVYDRKRALLVTYAGFLIGTFLCALCYSFELLVAVRFLTGLFGGLIGAIVLSIASDLFKYEERGKAMGAVMAGFSAAAALGLPFGLLISYNFSWHYAFYFIALFGVPVWLGIYFKFPKIADHIKLSNNNRKIESLTFILKDSNQVMALVLGIVLVFGHFLTIPFIAPYMELNVGFSEHDMILMYLIGGGLTVFSSPLFGKLVDRYGALRMYIIILFISCVPTLWVTQLLGATVTTALIATSLFFVFGSGRIIAPQTMISAVISAETRGSFMSCKAAFQQLAIFLATILGGFIVSEQVDGSLTNYHWMGYLSVAVLIPTILIARRLKVVEGN